MRWSTPVHEYTELAGRRHCLRGEARWHATAGEYTYIDLRVDELELLPA